MARDDLAESVKDEVKAAQRAEGRSATSDELDGQEALPFTPIGDETHIVDASGVVTTEADAPKEHKSFGDEVGLPNLDDTLECDTCGTIVISSSARQNGSDKDRIRNEGDACGVPGENPSDIPCAGKLRAHATV